MDCFPQIRQGLWKREGSKEVDEQKFYCYNKGKENIAARKDLGHEEKMDNRDCGGGDGGSLCTGIFRL